MVKIDIATTLDTGWYTRARVYTMHGYIRCTLRHSVSKHLTLNMAALAHMDKPAEVYRTDEKPYSGVHCSIEIDLGEEEFVIERVVGKKTWKTCFLKSRSRKSCS